MITFHNDHLVSPEFCKLINDTVPEEYHIPVVFVPHTKEYMIRGWNLGTQIGLNLQSIFYKGYPGEFKLWKFSLYITYHEFGHTATTCLTDHIPDSEYRKRGRGYSYIERLADDWANEKLLELAKIDKRLCQPKRLGPYFDGRIVKHKNKVRAYNGSTRWVIEEYRRHASGGQLSAGEIAREVGAFTHPFDKNRWQKPDSRLVNKLAEDLAYIYTDRIGRKYRYYAWGDIWEIWRRLIRYKATHGSTPGEIEDSERRLAQYTATHGSGHSEIDYWEWLTSEDDSFPF